MIGTLLRGSSTPLYLPLARGFVELPRRTLVSPAAIARGVVVRIENLRAAIRLIEVVSAIVSGRRVVPELE